MTDSVMPSDLPDDGYPPRDERVALQRKISLKFKEFRGFVTEFSDNLSLGGMFIRTTTPAPIGTVFDFEFSLEEGEPLVHGIGQVIWVRDRDEGFDHPAGIGVRFLFVDPEGRQLVERLVADRLTGGAPITELELGPPPQRSVPLAPAPIGVSEELPSLGVLDSEDRKEDFSPWLLEAPPIDPPTGPIPPLLSRPRSATGARGRGAARPSRGRPAAWKILAALLALGALAALGWYAATLLGLVGPTEPEPVTLRAIPVPGPSPTPERVATLPPAGTESAPVEPAPEPVGEAAAMPSAEPAPESNPSSAAIEPVEPLVDDSAETTAEERLAGAAPGRRGRGERHFKTIESITWEERPDGIDVILTADGKVEEWDYTLLHLTGPPRELIKIENVERGFTANTLAVGSRDLPRIRIGFHDTPGGNELHVVLDLATPSVRVEHADAQGQQIRVKIVGPR